MAITRTRLGTVVPGTATPARTVPMETSLDIDWTDSATSGGGAGPTLTSTTSGGGSASGPAAMLRAQTEYQKYLSELQQDIAKQLRAQEGTRLQAEYLRGQLGAGVPSSISGEITAQETAGRQYIEDQARALLDLLGGRRTQAIEEVGRGYGALSTYLQQNAPQAFAQAQRAVPEITQSALSRYMAGQGVSPAAAEAAAQVANVQTAGGAANFNQLLNVLAAREAAAQQSRMTEAEQARASAVTGLESLYGAGTAQLEQQRLAALADLASRISNARLAAQQTAVSREQSVQDALARLLGSGNLTQEQVNAIVGAPAPTTTAPTPPPAPTPVEQLAAKTANIKNQALVNRIENFVASNPNATPAQIKKQFPSLGKNITR